LAGTVVRLRTQPAQPQHCRQIEADVIYVVEAKEVHETRVVYLDAIWSAQRGFTTPALLPSRL
jgi:hypothetical protein